MKDTYLSLPSGGKITDIESTGFESYNDAYFGFRAYIKFNNGILICYGRFSKLASGDSITFLEPFSSSLYSLTISRVNATNSATTSNSAIWSVNQYYDKFDISGDESADEHYGIWGNYIAIGTWK
mgnify:CR=1 FL=1